MTKRVEWEDILPEYIKHTNFDGDCKCEYHLSPISYKRIIEMLKQAERDGLICRNVPSADEIDDIIDDALINNKKVAKALHERLTKGE